VETQEEDFFETAQQLTRLKAWDWTSCKCWWSFVV